MVWCEVECVCCFYSPLYQAVSQRFKEVIIVEAIRVPKVQGRRSTLTDIVVGSLC